MKNATHRAAIAAATAIAALATVAKADEISFHPYYYNGSLTSATDNGVPLDSSGAAGAPAVAQQGNWNNLNLYNGSNSMSNPVNSQGAVVTGMSISMTYGAAGDWGSAGNFTNSLANWTATHTLEDEQLYADTVDNTNGAVTITLANVPYSSYSVYLYAQGKESGTTNPNIYEVSDTTKNFYFNGATLSGFQQSPLVGYSQATAATSGSATAANYSVFSESSSDVTFTISNAVQSTDSGANAYNVLFYGVQIVATPEPASIGLFGALAGISLLRRRRSP